VDVRIAYAALIIAIISLGIAAYTSIKLTSIVEEQNRALQELNSKLENVATVDDVDQLVAQVEEIQARLLEYPTKEDIQALQERIILLEEALNKTYEAIFFPAEIVDGTGDLVVVPARPERIVSLAPAVTETLYYVGAADRIVGVDSYSNWPAWIVEARNNGTIIDVGGPWTPSVEAILAADPDLVIGVAGIGPQEQVKKILAAYGIPVILLPQESITDIKRSIMIVGYATGNVEEAASTLLEFEANLSRIQVAGPPEKRSVALIVWVNPLYVAGSNTFQGDMLVFVGAENAFANVTGWGMVAPEALIEAGPDIIILSGVDLETFYQFINETLGDAAQTIPAIANNLVFCVGQPYNDMLVRPSPRIVGGLILLQYIIYPEVYGATWDDIPRCINETTLPSLPVPPMPQG